jgi:hypothetical protein
MPGLKLQGFLWRGWVSSLQTKIILTEWIYHEPFRTFISPWFESLNLGSHPIRRKVRGPSRENNPLIFGQVLPNEFANLLLPEVLMLFDLSFSQRLI